MTQEKLNALESFPIGVNAYFITNGVIRPVVVVWCVVLKNTVLFTLRMADIMNNETRIVKMQDIGVKLFTTEELAQAKLAEG